jgi:hypothetical protein
VVLCPWSELLSAEEVLEAMMNESASIHHLEQILAAYPTQHFVFFWDRVRWHKGSAGATSWKLIRVWT